MKFLPLLFSVLLLAPTAAQAQPTKADCKAYAESVTRLAKQLELTPDVTGRDLLQRVETWIKGQDEQTLEQVIGQIEEATAGVRQCEASGFSSKIIAIKSMSMKLESAVLPWLRNTTAVDACQTLISQAARKKDTDRDGAIADLERSVRECKDALWLPEAHHKLAAMYYERGDTEKNDFENARQQTRSALEFSSGHDDEDREAFVAILAKPVIETGKRLMDEGNYAEARRQWEAYRDIFGTYSFDVLFRVEQVAQGAWMLRELKDARYQMCLACIDNGDVADVRQALLPLPPEYENNLQPFKALTRRVLQCAAEAEGPRRENLYVLAFDLLDAWHETDPDSYQIDGVLEDTLLAQGRDERLRLLRLTDKCWIPMQVVEALRRKREEYIGEAEVAVACGGSGAEAQRILNEFYVQAANDKLDRRIRTARSVQEKRSIIREVEEELLPKIADREQADRLRSRLAQERARLQEDLARMKEQTVGMFSGCTELLATIQWNIARENDYDREVLDFKESCCRYLMSDTDGWVDWMRSRPEGERLADAEIENKRKLMSRYCAPAGG